MIMYRYCIPYMTVQTHVLDEAVKHQPDTWWWLKADGCDLVKGLAESMKGIWSGDINLNDGELEQQYKHYQDRLSMIMSIKLSSNRKELLGQLTSVLGQLKEDVLYLLAGNQIYNIILVHTHKLIIILLYCTCVALPKAQKDYEEKVCKLYILIIIIKYHGFFFYKGEV